MFYGASTLVCVLYHWPAMALHSAPKRGKAVREITVDQGSFSTMRRATETPVQYRSRKPGPKGLTGTSHKFGSIVAEGQKSHATSQAERESPGCVSLWRAPERPCGGANAPALTTSFDRSSLQISYLGNLFRASAMSLSIGAPYPAPALLCACPVM
jgi:hypothetical protein